MNDVGEFNVFGAMLRSGSSLRNPILLVDPRHEMQFLTDHFSMQSILAVARQMTNSSYATIVAEAAYSAPDEQLATAKTLAQRLGLVLR
jgi:hypothetical protein